MELIPIKELPKNVQYVFVRSIQHYEYNPEIILEPGIIIDNILFLITYRKTKVIDLGKTIQSINQISPIKDKPKMGEYKFDDFKFKLKKIIMSDEFKEYTFLLTVNLL